MSRFAVGLAGLVALACLPPRVASATPPRPGPLAQTLHGDAKRDYDGGKLLASDGDYGGALLKFQSAYDASHDPRLLWNVAFCEKQLRHYARVLVLLRRYEAEGSSLLTVKDRADARDLAAALEPFTTTLTIRVDQDGAQVFVDDERVGVSPLGSSVRVDIGTHHLRATKPGYLDADATVPVGGGTDLPLQLHLERDVHEGRIVVHAPAGATITLDGAAIGTGSADRMLPSGGHQLDVRATGMRPFKTEVVVADRETRSLDIMLDRLSDAELPRIRVAVGCIDARPRSAAEGLAMYVDHSAVAASPIEVHTRLDPATGRDTVAWVGYPALPGQHSLELRAPGCLPAVVTANVRDPDGTQIDGALAPPDGALAHGPTGSPDGWSVGVGLWAGALVQDDLYSDVFAGQVGALAPPHGSSIAAIGPALDASWTWRWMVVRGSASLSWGDASGSAAGVEAPVTKNAFGSWSTAAHLTQYRFGARVGPRLPLGVVALSAGAGVALGVENVSASEWQSNVTHVGALGGAWAALDVKPLCDWALTATLDDDFVSSTAWHDVGAAVTVGYQPNARCRGEAATQYGVREEATP